MFIKNITNFKDNVCKYLISFNYCNKLFMLNLFYIYSKAWLSDKLNLPNNSFKGIRSSNLFKINMELITVLNGKI